MLAQTWVWIGTRAERCSARLTASSTTASMAYPYRDPRSPRDEHQATLFSNANPLSPQRHPNRLSGGMLPASDVRAGLTRRFTTNALPTLSPIGQQRAQLGGGYAVSPMFC